MLFENFRQILFVKPDFMIAVRNTAVYTVSMVVLLIFFAVIFALWMYKDRAINRVAQTVFFTPHLVATISCAFIWSWLYNSNSYGLFNSILALFGINPIRWLDTTDTAMLSVIIMNIWKGIGYYARLLCLRSKPSRWKYKRPSWTMHPFQGFQNYVAHAVAAAVFMLITITGSFKVFDSIRIMTNGGDAPQVMTM